MSDEELQKSIDEAIANAPRVPYIDWGTALAANILRELESRMPGFSDGVRARIMARADKLATSDDEKDREDAPLWRELADAKLFTEQPSAANG